MADHPNVQADYGTGEKNFNIYFKGIMLCIILTLVPFVYVTENVHSYNMTLFVIFVSAFLQFVVQLICFLRLNFHTEQAKMNVLSFVFSLIILFIVIAGSLWIMWNLDYNMMH